MDQAGRGVQTVQITDKKILWLTRVIGKPLQVRFDKITENMVYLQDVSASV